VGLEWESPMMKLVHMQGSVLWGKDGILWLIQAGVEEPVWTGLIKSEECEWRKEDDEKWWNGDESGVVKFFPKLV